MRRALALISGGKDSVYAAHIAVWQGFNVVVAGTIVPPQDSLLFHYENAKHAGIHAEALRIPHILVEGDGEEALRELLLLAKEEYNVEWLICGAIASEFQRFRFNKVASELGIYVHTPLWHLNPEKYLRGLIDDGFRFLIVSVGVEGLEDWVGRIIDKNNVEELLDVAREGRFNPAGEGGEYETFLIESPLYRLSWEGEIVGGKYRIRNIWISSRAE